MENHYRKALHGKTFNYSIEEYPFKALLTSLYGCELESIQEYIGDMDTFDQANDQKTLIHKVFYSNFQSLIEPLYIKFIKNIISPIIKDPFYYQKIPTFRIGVPGNKFVGEFHKDSKYNHQSYEVNFNLGICGCTGDAALQVEKSEGSNKFYILELNTQPGMTSLSLVPEIASYTGIIFEDLVEKILLDASINR